MILVFFYRKLDITKKYNGSRSKKCQQFLQFPWSNLVYIYVMAEMKMKSEQKSETEIAVQCWL